MALRTDYTQPQAGLLGFARTRKDFGRRVTINATDLVTGGQVAAFKLPAGITITSILAVFNGAMDTNGSPTLTISIGDAASNTRYLNASTTGRAGGTVNTLATTGVLYNNPTDTDVLITATAGSATAAAGTIDLYLGGFVNNP